MPLPALQKLRGLSPPCGVLRNEEYRLMAKKKGTKGTVPEIPKQTIEYQKWVSRAYGFAAACLFGLAIAEVAGAATPLLRTILMLGILAAGTAAWVMQAKRVCAKCGHLYGYHFRLVNANICTKCGEEFPPWRPGMTDGANAE